MAELDGQVALVTGGGRGIGRAIAQTLAEAGAAVAITARTEAQLDETAALIAAAGGRAVAMPGDSTSPDTVAHILREVEARLDTTQNLP